MFLNSFSGLILRVIAFLSINLLFLFFIVPSLSCFFFPSFYFPSIYLFFYVYIQFYLNSFPPRNTALFWSWDATQGLPASAPPGIHKRAMSADTDPRNTKLTNLSPFPFFLFLEDAKRFWIIKESRSWTYLDVQSGAAGSTVHQSVQSNTGTNGDQAITPIRWCIVLSRCVSDLIQLHTLGPTQQSFPIDECGKYMNKY
jgi:hypothetical protein